MTSSRRSLAAITVLLAMTALLRARQDDSWIGFRYDDERVLFYAASLVDPVQQHDYARLALEPPVARYGRGGYLLPLTPERLATFQPATVDPGRPRRELPAIGSEVMARSGSGNDVACIVERYVEQLGSDEPVVNVGVLARVKPASSSAFRAARGDHFLVTPPNASVPRNPDIRVRSGELWWCVTLYLGIDGEMRPSATEYCYRD